MSAHPHWMHQNFPYGKFGVDHLRLSRKGIELFNQQHYWECHEEFEEHWLEDRSDNARYVYWAIIQVAASLIHYRDKKLSSALTMLAKAKEKLSKCHEYNVTTTLMTEFLNWEELEALVNAIPVDANLEDFEALYHFRFTKYPFEYFKE